MSIGMAPPIGLDGNGGFSGNIYDPSLNPNYGLIGTTVAPLSPNEQQGVNISGSSAQGGMSLFNPSVSGIMNILQGNFPGLNQATGNMMNTLFGSLWNEAQPALEQGIQSIESEATGLGQSGGISTPAAGLIKDLYSQTLSNILGQTTQAGVNQYGQDLGLQSALFNLGMQQPQNAINQLLQTGGLQRGVGQEALNSLYQQYLQQLGLSQSNISNIMNMVTGGIEVPYEPPTQYGPSQFGQVSGGLAALLPLFTGGGS